MAYSESHWRNSAAPIIAKVIQEHAGEDESAVRLALRDAYPFGVRRHHPYKVWLDEIAVQLGKKAPVSKRANAAKAKIASQIADETVGDLFPEAVAEKESA